MPLPGTATVEIVSLQREASSMPDWAAYKAHMDMGFRLSAKQRWVGQGVGCSCAWAVGLLNREPDCINARGYGLRCCASFQPTFPLCPSAALP